MAESLETRQLLSVTHGTSTAHAGRQGNGPRRSAVDPAALRAGGAQRRRDRWRRLHQVDPEPGWNRSTRSRSRVRSPPRPGWSARSNPAPAATRNVYFQNLIVTPTGELGKIDVGQVSNFRTVQNGILAIDMPDFYLAHTETTTPSVASLIHTTAMSAGEIDIPQGVITLRFGGVDVDYTPAGGTPLNQTGQSNEFQINLGLPIVQGTSIIVNTVNSDARSQFHPGSPPFQDYATFLVTGRLNLFQANTITGNTTAGLVPSQFAEPDDPQPVRRRAARS